MVQKISSQSDFVADIQALKNPHGGAIKNDSKELKAVAKQFESLFLNMMMQSMRQAERVWSEDNPLNSRETEFFQDMLDQQLSADLSKSSALGIADMIVKQFNKYVKKDDAIDTHNKKPFSMPDAHEPQKIHKKNKYNMPEMPLSRLSHYLSDIKSESTQPQNKDLNTDIKNAFVEKIRPSATQAAAALGIDPLILIAQAALETGWGQHMPKQDDNFSSHNMFGIKTGSAWSGEAAKNITHEYEVEEGWKQETASFRSYGSAEDSFEDYVRFIQNNSRYQHLQNSDPQTYTNGLQQAGFATDPEYANKIMKIIHQLR